MSFLAPLFLLGALAIVGPILFHLIRRTTREVTPFSTLMFLQPTPPRVTRRSRLENLWLLVLRCLVLGLLALAFARPLLQRAAIPPAESSDLDKRLVLLLDTSASMRRESLWEDARAKAEEILRKVKPTDEVAVLAFDRTVRPVLSFEEWQALPMEQRVPATLQRLSAMTPSWGSTQLGAALLRAAELLDQPADDRSRPREIMVVSDLQEGAKLDELQGYEWPRGISVAFEAVQPRQPGNASAHWISDAGGEDKPATESSLRLRVMNAAESNREQFQLSWEIATAGEGGKLDLQIPAAQSRIVQAPKQPANNIGVLKLSGDAADFDNTVFVLPPRAVVVPLLFVGKDAEDDPRASLFYLRRAFPKTRAQSVEITAHRENTAVPAAQLQQAQLAVLGDGAGSEALASARQFALDGRIVLLPFTSAASAEAAARLLERPQLSATEAAVKDYALLAQIDFQHPLFTPFADPRFSDFTKIHFWKYRRLDLAAFPEARVLARFDSGDPALVQVPLGKGSVILLASSWQPADSQLALSSKFVPLLHALLEQSSNVPLRKLQHFIGDEIALPPSTQPTTIRKPDGSEMAVDPGAKFTAADQPGIYTIQPANARFVVNLAPEESRTSPLPATRFTSLGIPLRGGGAESPTRAAERLVQAQTAEVEQRQKLWRWAILAALSVLLLETFFAGKLSRSIQSSTPTTP